MDHLFVKCIAKDARKLVMLREVLHFMQKIHLELKPRPEETAVFP